MPCAPCFPIHFPPHQTFRPPCAGSSVSVAPLFPRLLFNSCALRSSFLPPHSTLHVCPLHPVRCPPLCVFIRSPCIDLFRISSDVSLAVSHLCLIRTVLRTLPSCVFLRSPCTGVLHVAVAGPLGPFSGTCGDSGGSGASGGSGGTNAILQVSNTSGCLSKSIAYGKERPIQITWSSRRVRCPRAPLS